MVTDVVTINQDAPLKEAVEVLGQHSFSGLPVMDEEGQLVGVVSEYDLLFQKKPLSYPQFINILGGIIHLENVSKFNEKLRKTLALKVEDVMSSDPITVSEEKELEEVAEIMVENKVNRLPVVKNNKLVGIVTRADLIRALAND